MGINNRRLDPKSGRIIYKTYQEDQDMDVLTFYGANRPAMVHYSHVKDDSWFLHYGNKYWMSQFITTRRNPWTGKCPEYLEEFDGYHHDTFFSGVAIKVSEDGESVKAFTFY